MAEQQQDKKTRFKTVQLFKDQIIGIGSYGKVCKAECDGLLCAAKVIHETLFDPTAQQLIAPQREHRLPMKRFEQECEFLSTIRHPNIIQYLGMYQDPDTHLPVLLMELMDDSLTQFLENSQKPIHYHIQVNISHDIALALSYLHSNDIVHRDLSSNNVLMISNIRAKVTDLGMAKLGDMNPRATYLTFTMCPGTDVYMPPEAVNDKPGYTEKIDCFSFGVIVIQIMTRLFPKPGDRRKEIQIEHIGLVEKRISEYERRENHISKIDPSQPLLTVALDCLKDKDTERPSAEELCRRIASMKQNDKYSKSISASKNQSHEVIERERSLRQQLAQQIESLQQTVQSQIVQLEGKNRIILQNDETIAAGLEENQQLREQLRVEESRIDGEILKLTKQLEKVIDEKEKAQTRIKELKLQLWKKDKALAEIKGNSKLKWRKGKRAPCEISNTYIGQMSAAVDGNFVYVMASTHIYAYNASTRAWSQLPDSSVDGCALAIVNNLLTLIGGRNYPYKTNKLFGLTKKGKAAKWTEEFPPMPTKRNGACALCTETVLIVAGGEGESGKIATTEVLNTATLQWCIAEDLPLPTFGGSLIQVSNDHLYMVGAYDKDRHPIKSMYTCSLNALLESCSPQSLGARLAKSLLLSKLWRRVTNIPAIDSSYVSFHNQLLAIGGMDSDNDLTTDIHMYDPSTNSWEVFGHMIKPRRKCYVAVLPDNQLMVVGGFIDNAGTKTDAVEIATSFN